MFYSWDAWLIRMQDTKQSVLLWIRTLDTIWYDKQLRKWPASCCCQFTPYKRDSLSTWRVTYMGHKASAHLTKGKKYFGLPGIKPWPLSYHASTVLTNPFCNLLVSTKIKQTPQMSVWTATIKFDHVLWQCAQFKQFTRTIYDISMW
jgi:hypothetical protein